MQIIQNFLHTRVGKILQTQKHRNRAALQAMRELGFSMPCIRRALIRLNEISIKRLHDDSNGGMPITAVTIYNTLGGARRNRVAMKAIAQALHLDVEDLFPPNKRVA